MSDPIQSGTATCLRRTAIAFMLLVAGILIGWSAARWEALPGMSRFIAPALAACFAITALLVLFNSRTVR